MFTLSASSMMRRYIQRKRKKNKYALPVALFLNFAVKKKAESPVSDY
jgi:hypothetical protein